MKRDPNTIWDYPVTDTELDQHYGVPVSEGQRDFAIGVSASDFDAGELGDVCATAFEQIAELIAANDAKAIGVYIMFLRRQRIADLASRKLYGKPGHIFAKEVEV